MPGTMRALGCRAAASVRGVDREPAAYISALQRSRPGGVTWHLRMETPRAAPGKVLHAVEEQLAGHRQKHRIMPASAARGTAHV